VKEDEKEKEKEKEKEEKGRGRRKPKEDPYSAIGAEIKAAIQRQLYEPTYEEIRKEKKRKSGTKKTGGRRKRTKNVESESQSDNESEIQKRNGNENEEREDLIQETISIDEEKQESKEEMQIESEEEETQIEEEETQIEEEETQIEEEETQIEKTYQPLYESQDLFQNFQTINTIEFLPEEDLDEEKDEGFSIDEYSEWLRLQEKYAKMKEKNKRK